MVLDRAYQLPQKMTDGPRMSPQGDPMTRKDDMGVKPSDGETTFWTTIAGTRSDRRQHKICKDV